MSTRTRDLIITEIIEVIEAIDKHPKRDKKLKIFNGVKYLKDAQYKTDQANNYIPITDIDILIDKLSTLCNNDLITDNGQLSSIQFELAKRGYYVGVSSRDTFGPTSAFICSKPGGWRYTFG